LGSAPASGAVGRALAGHSAQATPFTMWHVRSYRSSARGRAEQQPRRLRSPFIPTALLRLRGHVLSKRRLQISLLRMSPNVAVVFSPAI